jgi:CSLREA domain-containing protein
MLALFGALPSFAATIIVNTATDSTTAGDGFCSLREAINNANAKSDTTSGDCNAGTGNDSIAILLLGDEVHLGSNLPAIENTLTIVGSAVTGVSAYGSSNVRIFSIAASATVTLTDLTVENGSIEASSGGGVLNAGTLTVTNCTFNSNISDKALGSGGVGGAIANEVGTLNVSNSLFVSNYADVRGGAIANDSGVVGITNSTFVNNHDSKVLSSLGGGIYDGQNQLLVISDSTFSNNNSAAGGNLYIDTGGVLEIFGTVLEDTIEGGFDCAHNQSATVDDLGYNIDNDGSCAFAVSSATLGASGQTIGDNVEAKLDPNGLQQNGGPNETIGLLPDSPAVAAIPDAQCPATDERGNPRPAPGQTACDIGAFEGVVSTPTATATATATSTVTQTATPSATATSTSTATATATRTATATPTSTATATPTATSTSTATATPTATSTSTATATATATATTTATSTATASATATLTPTATPTPVAVTLKIKPKSLKFPKTKVGTPSKSKTVKVSNPQGKKKHPGISVLIEMVTDNPGVFTQTNNCPASLAAGSSCTIMVTFTPSAAMKQTGTLTITDNAQGGEQTVQLSGTGK